MQKTYAAIEAEALVEANPNVSYALIAEMVGTGKSVLDVGCGPGNLAAVLQGRGSEVFGVDADANALRAAARYCAGTAQIDLDTTPLADVLGERRFDAIVFADILEHLRDPAHVLQSARALLAPGGFVVASIPNVAHGAVRLAFVRGRFEYQGLGILDHTHVRFFTHDSVERLFEESGFVVTGTERTTAPVFEQSDLVPLVRREDFDPAVVDEVMADPEAETLQFIVRGYPLDDVDLVLRLRSDISSLEQTVRTLRAELAQARAAYPGASMVVTHGEYLPAVDGDASQLAERLARVQSDHRHALQLSDELRRQLANKEAVSRAERNRLTGEIGRLTDEFGRLHGELATLGSERATLSTELARRDEELGRVSAALSVREAERTELVAELRTREAALERLSAELAQHGLEISRRGTEIARLTDEIATAGVVRGRLQEQLARAIREHDEVALALTLTDAECERLGERLERAHALLELREATARDQDRAADRLLTALERAGRRAEVGELLAFSARAPAALAQREAAAIPRPRSGPPAVVPVARDVIVHDAPRAAAPLRSRLAAALRRVFPR
jgi:O-antigen biosynthesis protein